MAWRSPTICKCRKQLKIARETLESLSNSLDISGIYDYRAELAKDALERMDAEKKLVMNRRHTSIRRKQLLNRTGIVR